MATSGDEHIQALALETDPVARVAFRSDGTLALANARARGLFRLAPQDIGKRLQDLELSYRPIELRSLIQEASSQHRSVSRKDVVWPSESGEPHYLDLDIVPLRNVRGDGVGVQVSFADVTRYRRLQEDLERSKNELETAYEELQSTNEELETTNTELRLRSDELNHANSFLGSILSGLEAGVVVVDPNFQVLAWNNRAEDMWGLRADEVQGRNLLNLDIGLPVEQLRHPVRTVLAKENPQASLIVECVNRRGRRVRCAVRATPLRGTADEVRGAIVMMEEEMLEHGA